MNFIPSTKDKGQAFDNPLLERLTRTNILVPLITFSILSGALLYFGFYDNHISWASVFPLIIAGVFSFSLVEYVMHRFLFHLPPKTEKMEKFAYKVHGAHHHYPKDKDRLAMPIPVSLLLATGFFYLFQFIMGDLVFGFLPGFLMGYASYLGVHYSVHAFPPPKNFLRILWIHHGIHHYKDPENAFGVSSPFWDKVFGTMPKR